MNESFPVSEYSFAWDKRLALIFQKLNINPGDWITKQLLFDYLNSSDSMLDPRVGPQFIREVCAKFELEFPPLWQERADKYDTRMREKTRARKTKKRTLALLISEAEGEQILRWLSREGTGSGDKEVYERLVIEPLKRRFRNVQ